MWGGGGGNVVGYIYKCMYIHRVHIERTAYCRSFYVVFWHTCVAKWCLIPSMDVFHTLQYIIDYNFLWSVVVNEYYAISIHIFMVFLHSRHCGRLLCKQCSSHQVPILKFDLNKAVRVCEICADSFVISVGGSH